MSPSCPTPNTEGLGNVIRLQKKRLKAFISSPLDRQSEQDFSSGLQAKKSILKTKNIDQIAKIN